MRIVAFAYACEPDKGSEPGAGWMFVRMLARHASVWVITRANNREAIEAALPSIPERNELHFVYVDPSRRLTGWKRGQRGVRLFYMLWQVTALREARKLHGEHPFDLAWHVTMANAWLGSTASLLGIPFVYGPVGGGVRMPLRLAPDVGAKGLVYEAAREVARAGGRFVNPLARISWRRAALILVLNPETRTWLPTRYSSRCREFTNAVIESLPAEPRRSSSRRTSAMFAGRLLPWKGGALAIRAISRTSEWTLDVFGDGPDRGRLERLAERLDVADRVRFHGWVARDELRQRFADADVFLFPSLHDDAPVAVLEALAAGLTVVGLDIGGPSVIGGPAIRAVSPEGIEKSVDGLARAIQSRPVAGHLSFERAADFTLDARTITLGAIAQELLDPATPVAPVEIGADR
jgi:glycosyltransferase involved in cell wall biosynthesis